MACEQTARTFREVTDPTKMDGEASANGTTHTPKKLHRHEPQVAGDTTRHPQGPPATATAHLEHTKQHLDQHAGCVAKQALRLAISTLPGAHQTLQKRHCQQPPQHFTPNSTLTSTCSTNLARTRKTACPSSEARTPERFQLSEEKHMGPTFLSSFSSCFPAGPRPELDTRTRYSTGKPRVCVPKLQTLDLSGSCLAQPLIVSFLRFEGRFSGGQF